MIAVHDVIHAEKAIMLKLEPSAAKKTRTELDKLLKKFENNEEHLAEQLEFSSPSIRRFMNGHSNGSPYLAYRISVVAGIPLSELVGEATAKDLLADPATRRRPGRATLNGGLASAPKATPTRAPTPDRTVRKAPQPRATPAPQVAAPVTTNGHNGHSNGHTAAPSFDPLDEATLSRIARGSGRPNELAHLAAHYRDLLRLTDRMQSHIVRTVLRLD